MARVLVEKHRVYVFSPYTWKDYLKVIPASRWNPHHRAWSYPITPLIYSKLFQVAALLGDKLEPMNDRAQEWILKSKTTLENLDKIRKKEDGFNQLNTTKTEPWDHQIPMSHWIGCSFGCLIYAHMGTGKTKTVIDAAVNYGFEKILIICPRSVISVWGKELQKHCPVTFEALELDRDAGTVAKRKKKLEVSLMQGGIEIKAIVINYEAVWREPIGSFIKDKSWDLIVLDESHRIKSPNGRASKYIQSIRWSTDHMAMLTGTPMPHSPLDIYAQMRATEPGVFGTSVTRFKETYAIMGGFEQKQIVNWRDLDHMRAQMDPITIQVGKDVLDLPPEVEMRRTVHLDDDEEKIYRELEKELIVDIKEGVVVANNALTRLLRLQQIVGGFAVTDDDRKIKVGNSRAKAFKEILEDIGNEPIIVFCKFLKDIETVKTVFEETTGSPACELSGQRNELQDWQDGKSNCLAVQIQTGGLGIDLTRSCYSVYYSIGFSLGDFEQSKARIHRPGQESTVTYIFMVAKNTVDEAIYKALKKKKEVVNFVLESLTQF